MIDAVLSWQWREPETLLFVVVPFVWWLGSMLFRRQQTSQYADKHLMAWVKADGQVSKEDENSLKIGQKTTLRPHGFSKAAGHAIPGAFRALNKLFSALRRFVFMWFRPLMLLSIAWIALVIALAGPRTLIPAPQEAARAGVDILVAMDTSRSMLAQDVSPNRFLQSKALLESLMSRLEPNDRLGLMAFAGRPHLVSPLSFDRDLFQHYLNLIRPGLLPTFGSELDAALAFGYEHLEQTAGASRVLLVFSNGEPEAEQLEALPEELLALAKQANTRLILVGVGDYTPSRLPSMEHEGGYVRANGLLVTSRLEEVMLKKLAAQLNGEYLKAERTATFLNELMQAIAMEAETRHFQSSQSVWEDHARPFMWIAFVALLWAFFPLRFRKVQGVQAMLPALLVVAFWSPGQEAVAAETLFDPKVAQAQDAYEAFRVKEFDLAQQLYDGLNDYQGWFGAGAAAYRQDDFESAVLYFREAALAGDSDRKRAQALFNLGNAYYSTNLLPHAIEAYEQALVYLPDYAKAEHNLALAKKRRALERGQQQHEDEQGDGQGEGTTSRDDSGAFYGGQKPNQNEAGEGVSGDAPEGEKDGREFVLPDEMENTDFTLEAAGGLKLNDTAKAILDQQNRIQRIEKFEQEMQAVDDNQAELLQRIFEREEGFQAVQEERHPLPGVKTW